MTLCIFSSNSCQNLKSNYFLFYHFKRCFQHAALLWKAKRDLLNLQCLYKHPSVKKPNLQQWLAIRTTENITLLKAVEINLPVQTLNNPMNTDLTTLTVSRTSCHLEKIYFHTKKKIKISLKHSCILYFFFFKNI